MSLYHRMVCECGHRSKWYQIRFLPKGDRDVHTERDGCDGVKAIQSKWGHRI